MDRSARRCSGGWIAARLTLVALLLFSVTNHVSAQTVPTAPEAPRAAAEPSDLKTPESFTRFPPVEPGDVSQTFVVQDGFELQLIAAEPLITDPVAMAIDERGRAFVVEMNDYPYTDAKTHKAWQDNTTDANTGRVRLLEDTDNDGKYDRSTVFAEGLSWPSGILCYQGGVVVTATPDIWYLKDTDNDGRADQRDQWFTGFRKYNVQAVMNNPVWGLDNYIYVAGSSNGGSVLQPGESGQKPIVARGDFRIDPRSHQLELQAGGARFGNAFDDWGNRFLCNIRNPAIHVVLDNRYLSRNPFFAAPSAIYNIAESGDQMPIYRISPVEPWRELRGRQWSADPTKKVPKSELTGGGVFTSTSGINVYRGSAYPPQYKGQMLVAEVANNVIYRQLVTRDGNTFKAVRADDKVEFVASTDTWFRPVNLYNAPDGTLYVLDMYREFIEHPWSIPDDIHARLDLTSGRDRGRIYRLAPKGFKPRANPQLDRATSAELVQYLTNPNSWYRETAQRLLVQRQDKTVVPDLRQLLSNSEPLAVAHALWTLVGLNAFEEADLLQTLNSDSPNVREQTLQVINRFAKESPQILSQVLRLVDDPDSRVRLQAAFYWGSRSDEASIKSLVKLASRDAEDPWMQIAILSSLPQTANQLLERLPADEFASSDERSLFVQQLAQIAIASDNQALLKRLFTLLRPFDANHAPSQARGRFEDAVWLGLSAGARRKNKSLAEVARTLPFNADELPADNSEQSQAMIARNGMLARNIELPMSAREAALCRISLVRGEQSLAALMEFAGPTHGQAIQSASLKLVGSMKDSQVAKFMIDRLKTLTPAAREEAFTILLARPDRSLALLDAIADGTVQQGLLGLTRKNQLLASTNPLVKQRATEILGKVDASRATVIQRFAMADATNASPERGRQVFMQHCAACHRGAGAGVEIGPHIETVRGWDRDKLLLNILDPNREVAPQSMSYAILLESGSVVSGMIAEETASSLTVKRANAPVETILRQDIQQITNTGQSLMPTGFEESINPAAMADLISFLRGGN